MARYALLCSLVLFSLLGCSDGSLNRAFEVPPTPQLSRPLGWGVVVPSYAQVYDAPGTTGVVLGYYRRGVVVAVTERRLEKTGDTSVRWILNAGSEPGWIRETDLEVFESEAKAKTAAGTMQP